MMILTLLMVLAWWFPTFRGLHITRQNVVGVEDQMEGALVIGCHLMLYGEVRAPFVSKYLPIRWFVANTALDQCRDLLRKVRRE